MNNLEKKDFRPPYRYLLRARIAESKFRTLSQFSREVGVNASRLSRIVGGWEFPSSALALSIADALNISPEHLKELL